MSSDHEHLEKIRRYFARIGVQPEVFLQMNGYTPAEGAACIDAINSEIMLEFEAIKRERPELLNISESERLNLERVASEFGTTFERELASTVVMRAQLSAQISAARKRRVKLRPADFPNQTLPAGIDDIIPPDLIDSESGER